MFFIGGQAAMAHSGPPTAYALRMRPWLLTVMCLLMPVALARCMVLDIVGGFSLCLTALLGMFSVGSNADITWMLCAAGVLFLNGLFDACLLSIRLSKSKVRLFDRALPWYWNALQVLLLAGPFLELVGSIICWSIFREHVCQVGNQEGFYAPVMHERVGYGATFSSQAPLNSPLPRSDGSRGESWTGHIEGLPGPQGS
eukprot:CAMPEP_0178381646 /NCGR_PEP_ID=MMETSP0689_2-20121128/6094_1 /TAXON_ID=160604 /ORGANISM="Amphidinium massartii, Strain CS-259" /LENGTH=198 /DNA_ID=CAMNT_0020001843 /DNA_START=66 /DNA_END=658 /DNA_ORIENTATION=+